MAVAVGSEGRTGLFGPGDLTWRVNRELVLLAGGGRALVLQVAHPLVGAGVAQHSGYEQDPWGRLVRTLDAVTTIVFGAPAESDRAARRLRARHASVQGTSDEGVPYDARDPDLLLWVWATLVDTSVLVYGRFVRPLTPAELDRYYAEQQRFALACGVPDGHWPEDWDAFRAYVDATVSNELRATPAARSVWASIQRPPRVPRALSPVLWPGTLLTVGLLPEALRAEFGFPWGPARERALDASVAAGRRLLPVLPPVLREFPQARAASARVRRAT